MINQCIKFMHNRNAGIRNRWLTTSKILISKVRVYMCRFNYIMIKDEIAEELLKQEEYYKVYDDLCGYRAYRKGYCNCDSFVGSLIDRKGMKYSDAIETCRKEKLERLYQVRNIMNQPGYKERKERYLQIRMKLTDELNSFSEYITAYEMQQTDLIQKEYSGEAFNNQMKKLYKNINSMITSLETQPDYLKKREAYADFLHENEVLEESTRYYLTKEEEDNLYSHSIPLSELLGLEDKLKLEKIEKIELPDESCVIDKVIARTEKDKFEQNLVEYNSYHKLFSDIIKYVPSFMFCTIWSEPNDLKNVKTVGIDSLLIDDLAFMDYDEMLCITK